MGRSANDTAWDEVKRLYCETDETIEKIAAKHGLCRSTVSKKAAASGWPPRRQRLGKTTGATHLAAVSRDGPTRCAGGTLEKRLYQVMIRKLEKMEQRMNADEPLSPADNEREMREIGTMIRGFEKVKEGGSGEKDAGDIRGASKPPASAHAERMRQEITERLERLCERSRSRQNSE